jgi:hypothetical protein
LSFEIYHPKNNVLNQEGNHDDNKVGITKKFLELTDNDGQKSKSFLKFKINEIKAAPFEPLYLQI